MKTTFDVLGHFYKAINVASVTSIIDGAVWRRKKPIGRTLQDVVIMTLPINGDENVQEGTVVVNAFCQNLGGGTPNETKLNTITDAVIAAIEAYTVATEYFSAEVISENTMQDPDVEEISYSSIRVNFYIES